MNFQQKFLWASSDNCGLHWLSAYKAMTLYPENIKYSFITPWPYMQGNRVLVFVCLFTNMHVVEKRKYKCEAVE